MADYLPGTEPPAVKTDVEPAELTAETTAGGSKPPSTKAQAWIHFDRIVAEAPDRDRNPWCRAADAVVFQPDFDTLEQLCSVPLLLGAASQSGVPALALDVWTAYELRRAGLHPDRVWPRATSPRVLPWDVSALLENLPARLRSEVAERLGGGVSGANANLLGKNYIKQVDVVMSAWQTGPELMISTKRMDSSFGKNAANRIEESYGDAKNLSLRYPQAALGFLYGLRSTAFVEEPEIAERLIDLLIKIGREPDAYDAVALLVPEWSSPSTADSAAPPTVTIRHDLVPAELCPGRFLSVMVRTALDNSPVSFHREARQRLRTPREPELDTPTTNSS